MLKFKRAVILLLSVGVLSFPVVSNAARLCDVKVENKTNYDHSDALKICDELEAYAKKLEPVFGANKFDIPFDVKITVFDNQPHPSSNFIGDIFINISSESFKRGTFLRDVRTAAFHEFGHYIFSRMSDSEMSDFTNNKEGYFDQDRALIQSAFEEVFADVVSIYAFRDLSTQGQVFGKMRDYNVDKSLKEISDFGDPHLYLAPSHSAVRQYISLTFDYRDLVDLFSIIRTQLIQIQQSNDSNFEDEKACSKVNKNFSKKLRESLKKRAAYRGSASISKVETISGICQLEPTPAIATQEQLIQHLNSLARQYSIDIEADKTKIIDLVQSKGLSLDPSLLVKNQQLVDELASIASLINSKQIERANIPSTNPISTQLKKIISYGDSEKRRELSYQEKIAYVKEIDKLLGMTKTGKKVLACYKKVKHPQILKERRVAFETFASQMAFGLDYDKQSDKEVMTISFNVEFDPIFSITAYAHEMQHGCRAAETIDEGGVTHTHNNVVDEIRAYSLQVNLYKELIKAEKDFFCNGSVMWYRDAIIPISQWHSHLEERLEAGVFVDDLLKLYAGDSLGKPYENDEVYTVDSSGQPKVNAATHRRVIRPDLLKKIKDAGFKVRGEF
jgi:hypothetical protein